MVDLDAIKDILREEKPGFVEGLAAKARSLTEAHFGRVISLYAPLYLSNYCDSVCVYCGFNNRNKKIFRRKLAPADIEGEMKIISERGIQNILLLTGESPKETPPEYLLAAVEIGKKYFPSIDIEVEPLARDDYRRLRDGGVDGLAVYQETYDRDVYAKVHLEGKKRDYDYRYQTPRRAAEAGIRRISMGVLLGLADVADDIYNLFCHLRQMQRDYPGVEYSLSFPRVNALQGRKLKFQSVSDLIFVKLICLARVLFPSVGINLSTRETPSIRNHAIYFGVTRISAASSTRVGGYVLPGEDDTQFDIHDHRSVAEIVRALKEGDLDPVFTDWRRL